MVGCGSTTVSAQTPSARQHVAPFSQENTAIRRVSKRSRIRYKLIYYYGEALGSGGAIDRSTPPEWELFDLEKDPYEMHNVYGDPSYAGVIVELKAELERLRNALGDCE